MCASSLATCGGRETGWRDTCCISADSMCDLLKNKLTERWQLLKNRIIFSYSPIFTPIEAMGEGKVVGRALTYPLILFDAVVRWLSWAPIAMRQGGAMVMQNAINRNWATKPWSSYDQTRKHMRRVFMDMIVRMHSSRKHKHVSKATPGLSEN